MTLDVSESTRDIGKQTVGETTVVPLDRGLSLDRILLKSL